MRAAPDSRPGQIQFSNGEAVEGTLSLTPGAELSIETGSQLRRVSFDRVQAITLSPEQEELVQKWRFVEAGKTQKQTEGDPYPVRHLRATMVLASGEKITGHLYTTVLYVEGKERTQKVVLWAKQRGKEGQTLDSLLYPTQVVFKDAADRDPDSVRLQARLPGVTRATEIVALTHGSLVRLEAIPTAASGEFTLPSALGTELFLAIKTGNVIEVNWPGQASEPLRALVAAKLADAEDFFDERKLLGVFYDQPNQDVYCLLLLSRKGNTTLSEVKNRPWRVAVLRWKCEPEAQRLMLAGRGYFYRGIVAPGEALPAVRASGKPWQVEKKGGAWIAEQ